MLLYLIFIFFVSNIKCVRYNYRYNFQLSDAPSVMGFFSFILPPFTLSQPSMCRSDGWLLSLFHQHLPETFGGSCKAEYHCSDTTSTSTLMRLES